MNPLIRAVRQSIRHDSDMAPIIASVPYCKPPESVGAEESLTDKEREADRQYGEYEESFRAYLEHPSDDGGYFLDDDGLSLSGDEIERRIDLLLSEPTVYIVYFHDDESGYDNYNKERRAWTVYVGETNHIARRTVQHALRMDDEEDDADDAAGTGSGVLKEKKKRQTKADKIISDALKRGIRVRQFVIHQGLFNKSLTLDIENRFIDYMHALDNVHCLNARTNAQGRYFTAEAKPYVISAIWNRLCGDNDRMLDIQSKNNTAESKSKGAKAKAPARLSTLFEVEENIWNLSNYKLSPFHSLGDGQKKAVDEIRITADQVLEQWSENSQPRLFLLDGSAGTGKSIVLSSLFYRLCNEYNTLEPPSVKLLMQNEELRKQYKSVAKLQDIWKSHQPTSTPQLDTIENVLNPSAFITSVDKINANGEDKIIADIVLVDEAHLLFTKGGYRGCKDGLAKILKRAKVVIAVFDPRQIVNEKVEWNKSLLDALFPHKKELKVDSAGRKNANAPLLRSEPYPVEISFTETPGQQPVSVMAQQLKLNQQFRMCASDAMVHWIQALTGADGNESFIKTGAAENGEAVPRVVLPLPKEEFPNIGDEGDDRYVCLDDLPYQVKIFQSPEAMHQALDKRRDSLRKTLDDMRKNNKLSSAYPVIDLCRMVATYDWPYVKSKQKGFVTLYHVKTKDGDDEWRMPAKWRRKYEPVDYPELKQKETKDDVEITGVFQMPWNGGNDSNKDHWVSRDDTKEEVGSYFTVQGADLNVAAVIIGPSVTCDYDGDPQKPWSKYEIKGHQEEVQYIQFNPERSKDSYIGNTDHLNGSGNTIDFTRTFICNQLNVLLTRGVRELYIYAVDEGLSRALRDAAGGYADAQTDGH